MKTKLDEKKLDELHKYIQETEDIDRDGIEKYLGEDPQPWIDALKEKHPDAYGEPTPEPAKKQAKKKAKEEPQPDRYFIVENGIKVELAVKAVKGSDTILEKVEPTDKVTVKIKGEDVVIDLLKLAKLPPDSMLHGTTVRNLIIFGELAKG